MEQNTTFFAQLLHFRILPGPLTPIPPTSGPPGFTNSTLPLAQPSTASEYLWKHVPPELPHVCLRADTLHVAMVRHPMRWIASTMRTPYSFACRSRFNPEDLRTGLAEVEQRMPRRSDSSVAGFAMPGAPLEEFRRLYGNSGGRQEVVLEVSVRIWCLCGCSSVCALCPSGFKCVLKWIQVG